MLGQAIKIRIVRVLFGSILAIASITIVAVVLQWLLGIGNDLQMATTLVTAMVAPIVSGIVVLFWGLPVYTVLTMAGRNEIRWYAMAGFIPAPVLVFAIEPLGADGVFYLVAQSLYFGMIGVVGAAFFWFFVVHQPLFKSPD